MKNNWVCAVDGSKKKLPDGRCAMCGRATEAESKLYADQWDKEAKHPQPQHTPTPDTLTIERYEIVSRYLNNQCALSWEQLVKTIINTEPEILLAVNAYEKDQEIKRELVKALQLIATRGGVDLDYATIGNVAREAIAKAEGK